MYELDASVCGIPKYKWVGNLRHREKHVCGRNYAPLAGRPEPLARHVATERPDQVWVGDLTYIPTRQGWLYLAVVIDLYTRMVVGWSMSERMTRHLVMDALRMAYFRRPPKAGTVFHSDRGSQYCSEDFQSLLVTYGMLASMSRKGDCWDNAVAESFFNSLKNERTHLACYATREEAKRDTFDYIEPFYNRKRRHSTLDYLSPAEYYQRWIHQRIIESAAIPHWIISAPLNTISVGYINRNRRPKKQPLVSGRRE
jgi:putative transposase